MFNSPPARWLAVWPAAWVLVAVAQPAPTIPAEAAEAPVASPKSAFEGYVPFTDEKPIPWKTANDTVQRRGGWQAYAKEATGDAHRGASHTPPKTTQPSSAKVRP